MYLSIPDLFNCSMVNKLFNRASKNNLIWDKFFREEYNEDIKVYQKLFGSNDCMTVFKKYKDVRDCAISLHKSGVMLCQYDYITKKYRVNVSSFYEKEQISYVSRNRNTIFDGIHHLSNLKKFSTRYMGSHHSHHCTSKSLTPEFGSLNLNELHIGNMLGSISTHICKLKKLKILELGNNFITKLPAELCNLTNLEVLDLSGNRIRKIPSEIRNMKNLQIVNLNKNNIDRLPNGLYALINLRELYLNHNKIKCISSKIFNLTNLTHLNLYKNHIIDIPSHIGMMSNLTSLDI